jgi:oligopeptide transport system ATP-binding protein
MAVEYLLEVENLVMHFPQDRQRVVRAVNGVSFRIAPGEALALVGESGSGKTTVGRSLLRLIEPTAGRLIFQGQDITAMPQSRFRTLRSRLQMVFQEPFASLNPRMRVGRIVEEPLLLAGQHNAQARRERCAEALALVGLPVTAYSKFPHQFSAGEQQRIGIARAIATRPDLVVLDEPTSALDVSVRAEILALLDDLRRKLNLAYLFISHDLAAVQRVCQRVAIMYLGCIIETGKTDDLFAQPMHPYSRALLSSALFPDPKRNLSRFLLRGEIPSPINLPPGCHLHQRCPWARPVCASEAPALEEIAPRRLVSCFFAAEENNLAVARPGLPHAGVSAGTTGLS